MMTTQPPLTRTTVARDGVATLRAFIAEGGYQPGDRLPAERALIDTLALSRNTLRKALDTLERDGEIWRHVGKGTFVADLDAAHGPGAMAALGRQMTPVRMIQARLCIEPALAQEAAIHASQGALTRICLTRDAARAATTWAEYEAQDDSFHRALAEASDNILLLTLFDQLNQVRRAVAGSTVVRATPRPPPDHTSFAEHDRIVAAIRQQDANSARSEMRAHIGSVSKRLFAGA